MAKVVRPGYRGPELLLEMVDHVAQIMVEEAGVDPVTAREVAIRCAVRLAETWGGQFIWFPRPRPHDGSTEHRLNWFELQARDLEIYRTFRGNNQGEVCERFGISRTRLYEIIGHVRIQSRAQLARVRATTPELTPAAPPAPATPDLFPAD